MDGESASEHARPSPAIVGRSLALDARCSTAHFVGLNKTVPNQGVQFVQKSLVNVSLRARIFEDPIFHTGAPLFLSRQNLFFGNHDVVIGGGNYITGACSRQVRESCEFRGLALDHMEGSEPCAGEEKTCVRARRQCRRTPGCMADILLVLSVFGNACSP